MKVINVMMKGGERAGVGGKRNGKEGCDGEHDGGSALTRPPRL